MRTLASLLLLLVILAPGAAFAQRALDMKVTLTNPNDYRIGMDIWTYSFANGTMDCRTSRGYSLAARSSYSFTCRASEGSRNVDVSGTADTTILHARLSQWGLRVIDGKHYFKCLFGCSLSEDWSGCGSSGPCLANVVITFNQKKEVFPCEYSCQSWNPASKSCIGPRMNSCKREDQ